MFFALVGHRSFPMSSFCPKCMLEAQVNKYFLLKCLRHIGFHANIPFLYPMKTLENQKRKTDLI